MTGNLKLLRNLIEKFMGTVCFGNDNFAAITSYEDYFQGNLTICHVYYVEGLGHNLFSVGQFCDGDLEVAFPSNTSFVRNLKGEDLLTGSRESNLYTISIFEMVASSPVYLMPFDYDKLNNLYDLFVPQREKSSEQRYFSERSRLSNINVNNGKSKEAFNKQTTLLEKRMDESIPLDKNVKAL
nr:integrase, catalytic region, zinc finger, CCHC-type, peptidase aspartic, catalytic [Tanacetum cinerariifolium]